MAATKLLANTYKKILNEPVEGFTVELADESNLYEWKIWIEGPKDTLYEGGVFQLEMKFPADFPMSPPELKFISDFWHPNVYSETGGVCISILHPPGVDEMSGELPEERWLPTQTVQTIILSVISLLNSPNFSSPANVDAGVEWRKNPEGYKKKILRLVEKANREKPSHIEIPHPDTNPEERQKQIDKIHAMNEAVDVMEDEMMYDSVDEEDEDETEQEEEEEEEEEEKKETKKVVKEEKKEEKMEKIPPSASTKEEKKKKKKKCIIM